MRWPRQFHEGRLIIVVYKRLGGRVDQLICSNELEAIMALVVLAFFLLKSGWRMS